MLFCYIDYLLLLEFNSILEDGSIHSEMETFYTIFLFKNFILMFYGHAILAQLIVGWLHLI